MSLNWITKHLEMGAPAQVAHLLYRQGQSVETCENPLANSFMAVKRGTLLVALAVALAIGQAGATTYYEITTFDYPLGSPGTTVATGVNNLGEVVGNYAGPDGDYNGLYPHAFQWLNGTYTQITNATSITGINDAGLAAGLMPGIGDGAGLLHDVHTLAQASFFIPGRYYTRIGGINNAGQVVGNWYDGLGSGVFIGYCTNAELVQYWGHPYVDHPRESTSPHGIDNLGRVTGYVQAHKPSGDPEKPYYVGGFITSDVTNPLAFTNFNVGAAITQVTASNTNGVMVGHYSTNGWNCGFIHKAGVTESFMIEKPRVISTEIWDVNERGWLVGSYVQLNEYDQQMRHGFLAVPTPPQPIPLEIRRVQDQLVFTWYSKAFTLQSAPDINGVFTNLPGATSPWTNTIGTDRLFFRLVAQ